MRIVKARFKVAYIIASFAVIGAVGVLLADAGLTGLADTWSIVAYVAMTVFGVRTFRVVEEDLRAPRPLWRMTGRPTAGFFLGGFGLLGAVGSLWSMIYDAAVVTPTSFGAGLSGSLSGGSSMASQIVSIVVDAAIALLYLRSSFRLARHMPAPAWTRG